MNKMEKNHNDRWAYWILLITALWYCVFGSFYLIAGITDLIALSRNKIHDNWWCLYFLLGILFSVISIKKVRLVEPRKYM